MIVLSYTEVSSYLFISFLFVMAALQAIKDSKEARDAMRRADAQIQDLHRQLEESRLYVANLRCEQYERRLRTAQHIAAAIAEA